MMRESKTKDVLVYIHDEFRGDVAVDCTVSGINIYTDVIYNEITVASELGLDSVPEDVDKDIRIRAVEGLIYSDEYWYDYKQERKYWESVT